MFIPDLTQLPADHPPSPYNVPLFCNRNGKPSLGRLPRETIVYAVGWLDDQTTTSGRIPDECIEVLFDAYISGAIFSDGSRGWHDCQLCSGPADWYPEEKVGPVIHWRDRSIRLFGHGHHLIRLENSVYMCPVLILHYILDHNYKPPEEFLQALTRGIFLTAEGLIWAPRDASDHPATI